MTSEQVPWRKYTKTPLSPGFTHPLGQRGVQAALEEAGISVDWLSLSDCVETAWRDHVPVRLLSVRRAGDAQRREWGDWPLAYQTHLSVNACPSAHKAGVHDVVALEALPRAIAWLRSASDRGNAWGASEHQLEILWDHPGVRYVEDRFR